MRRLPVAHKIVTPLVAMMIVLVSLATAGCDNMSGDYDTVKRDLGMAQSRVQELEAEKDSLQNSHDTLQTENQQLENERNSIQNSHDTLQTENQQLENERNSIQSSYETLEDEWDSLQAELSGLNMDYQALQTQDEELVAEKTQLQEDCQTLTVEKQGLEDQRDSLQNDYNALTDWYNDIRQTVNFRQGLSNDDRMLFLTPNNPAVAAKVQEVTGGFSENVNEQWADYKQMYDWIVANISYSYDSPLPVLPYFDYELQWRVDYWRMPNETLQDETGDCEDMALLLASMRDNYLSGNYSNWVIAWTSEDTAHAATAFPVVGGELTILDPAGNFYTNKPYSLGSESVSDAVDDWLAQWPGELGIHVSAVFSDAFYETFATTDDFVEWVLAR